MKYVVMALLLLSLLAGCASARRSDGEPYPGYSCRESFMHFYSQCSNDKFTKDEFEAKVQVCEKELATKICDKEQAGLLWCMGRVAPGMYTIGGGYYGGGFYGGNSNTTDGCDCSSFIGDLRKCRMEKGIFDK